MKRDLRQDAAPSTGTTPCSLCLDHPKHPRFFVDKLWQLLHPDAARRRRRGARSRRSTASDYEIRPVVDAILRHPALYTGPRMVKPPVVYTAGLLRALGRGVDTQRLGVARRRAGQRLFYPPNVAGWDDERWLDTATFRGRWGIANEALPAVRARPTSRRPTLPRRRRRRSSTTRSPSGHPDASGPATRAALVALRAHARSATPTQDWKQTSYPPLVAERPAPADRRVPRPPDRMSRWPAAATTSRAPSSSAARAAEAGPRAAGDRAGHAAARGHRARPAQLPRRAALGLALAVYGGSALRPRAFEEGIAARGGAAGPQTRARLRLPRRRRRLALDALPGEDPLYRKLRPRLALPASAGVPFAEDDRLRWHPSLAPLATLHGEGKVTVHARRRLHRPRTSRTSPRATSGRSARSTSSSRTGWLGRYLDRVGSPDNPLQGLSLDWRLQPALATAKMPVASIDGPDRYDFWTRGVWGDVETRMLDAIGALGALPDARRRRRSSRRRRRARRPRSCAGSCSRSAPKDDKPGLREPGRLPGRATTVPAPARRSRRDARRRPAAALRRADRARRLRHARRPAAGARRRAEAHGRLACSRSSATSRRAASPTACSSTSGRSSAAAREENGSSGTDHGAAGAGFLIGTRASGTMIGEFPGLGTLDERRQPARDRPTSAASTPRCSSSGSAPTPRRSSRAPRKFAPPEARQVIATALALLTLAAPAPARVQVGADEFGYSLSRAVDQGRAGDRAARQLRRGRARPAPPPRRRHDASTASGTVRPGRRRRARGALPPRPFHALVLARRSPQARA